MENIWFTSSAVTFINVWLLYGKKIGILAAQPCLFDLSIVSRSEGGDTIRHRHKYKILVNFQFLKVTKGNIDVIGKQK